MWPFSKKQEPDNRPPSLAAKAITVSLLQEPERWKMTRFRDVDYYDHLQHDSGVTIDTEFLCVVQPWTVDDPDADEPLLREAVDRWIADTVNIPKKPEPAKDPTP